MSRVSLPLAFAIIAIAASLASAKPEAPINRVKFLRVAQAPYPAAGYRPQGEQFRLPARQQTGSVYGPPTVPDTTEEMTTTTEMPTTTDFTLGKLSDEPLAEKFDKEEGVYYIYHPDGLLQKVVYAARSEDMGYTARLTYKDVEPIKEPIYTYDPQTLAFSQIEV